jgi:DNA replication and repair protein RecF
MLLAGVELHDFRSYAAAQAALSHGLTVVRGRNGAGKSNLLEAICFGCTGRSPRTRNDRELIRFGASAARVTLRLRDDRDGEHELSVGFGTLSEGAPIEKRVRFDGAPVQRAEDVPGRPLVIVFVPDRLELVSGPPAVRRAHLDHLVAALWPSRSANRAAYARALAQRNALVARMRAGEALSSWNLELARHALSLTRDRAQAVEAVAGGFTRRCEQLGLAGRSKLEYRPRCRVEHAEEFAAELQERLGADLERGYTTHGPHRDEIALLRDGRQLRTYGSQGERRLALLALLLSERAALREARGHAPLMLLDDVMSELDADRRQLLLGDLAAAEGQSVIATADLAQVPASDGEERRYLGVLDGTIAPEGPVGR